MWLESAKVQNIQPLNLILAINLELRITNDKNWPFCDLNIGKRESNVKARSEPLDSPAYPSTQFGVVSLPNQRPGLAFRQAQGPECHRRARGSP
jgi:hypothetical protein